ncbi:MAG: hypothetical protein CMP57_04835 [Flavobacteriales bacterium]|nr:hypothetical protein [Flavobacteriales bacterium]|tara:strand:+ start:17538 stop:19877 length:2340 start_codon:yes stop_codon:yes gene_type:complete
MKKLLLPLLFCILNTVVLGQNIVSGKITDQDKEEIIGVNISVKKISGLGSSSDVNGNYQITLPKGCHQLLFQFIGYRDITQEACPIKGKTLVLNIELEESFELLETVVISAGKFEQKIEEITVSMDVIKPSLIENKSASSLDKTMNQSPSVHIVDGQANIRSGSGWSYGAGSRVMVMVDGIPLMNGDQGAVEWQLVPMENISQIEIIKGASSVLFGSAALNGTINIRTAYPTDVPLNKILITETVYGKPKSNYNHWYQGKIQRRSNYSFLHSHKKNNSDFVLGMNLFYDAGFYEGVTSKRARININKTYYSNRVNGLLYGIKANLMRSEIKDPIMWQNNTEAYTPLNNDPGNYNNAYITIDPFLTFNNVDKNIKYSLNGRYFHKFYGPFDGPIGNYTNIDSSTYSMVNYLDAQIQKNINENLSLTSGYTFNLQRGSDSKVFGNHIFLNNSLYSQVNFNKNRLNASMGGRYEHFIGSGETLSKPIFRGGINYRFGQATFFRASYGEGIRFPSMLERYVNYETGPMTIFPNEDLKPETGWSGEFGIKQGIKIGEWKGFVDLAAFKMSYENMMEFSFGKWGTIDDGQLGGFGFKSVNIGNTYIEGLEFSIAGEGNIGKTKIQILGGYTYTNPQIDDINYVYDEYLKGYDEDSIPEYNPISYLTTSSDTSGVLKYRYRHLFKFDINLERNRFSSGLSMRFNSQMENIDIAFIEPLFNIYLGTATAWENLNRDLMLLDFRVGYDITEDTRILLNVDNVFNSEQSLRPASLSAPRTYSVLLRMIF